jgi:hypothetical protein
MILRQNQSPRLLNDVLCNPQVVFEFMLCRLSHATPSSVNLALATPANTTGTDLAQARRMTSGQTLFLHILPGVDQKHRSDQNEEQPTVNGPSPTGKDEYNSSEEKTDNPQHNRKLSHDIPLS